MVEILSFDHFLYDEVILVCQVEDLPVGTKGKLRFDDTTGSYYMHHEKYPKGLFVMCGDYRVIEYQAVLMVNAGGVEAGARGEVTYCEQDENYFFHCEGNWKGFEIGEDSFEEVVEFGNTPFVPGVGLPLNQLRLF